MALGADERTVASEMSAGSVPERRRELQIKMTIPVRISGVDGDGNPFEEDVTATKVRGSGALLLGVERRTRCGDLIGITYKGTTAQFTIVWIQDFGSKRKFKLAVRRLEGESCAWQELLSPRNAGLPTARTVGTEATKLSEGHGETQESGTGRPEETYRYNRRWRRHKVDVPIRVIVHGTSKTSLFDGRGNELSEGGMALTAGVELRPGDVVDVEFTPPYSGAPIRHRGIVRNRTGYRYGIEFLSGSHRDAEQTERLLTMMTST